MTTAWLAAYPWDLLPDNLDGVLDRLRGEVGVTGVSVWAATPPVLAVRSRRVDPRIFRTRGGLFFQPEDRRYVATRCKPILSEWARTRQPLERIAEKCTARSMPLRVILSASATGRLAERHPEFACKNVFGDPSRRSVCLVNADVEAYLDALLSDISTKFSLSAVTLTDMTIAWQAERQTDMTPNDWLGSVERSLVAACFCESCYRSAQSSGVDVDAASRAVTVKLQQSMDAFAPSHMSLGTMLEETPPIRDFFRWRSRALNSLLTKLTRSCGTELILETVLDDDRRIQYSEIDLHTPAAVMTRLDRLEELEVAASTKAARSEARFALSCFSPANGPEFVSALSRAAELGIAGAQIDNYGLLPESALTTIRRAIRYGRRSAPT